MNILVLDGGGCGGIAAIKFLKEFELKTGKPVRDHFDLICGVSTGALIGAGISTGMETAKLLDFYIDSFPKIFKKTFWGTYFKSYFGGSKYDIKNLINLLETELGPITIDKLVKKFMVSAVKVSGLVGTRHWKSWKDNDNLIPILAASCAAPYYFEPVKINGNYYTDGGVACATPVVDAITEGMILAGDEKLNLLRLQPFERYHVKREKAQEFGSLISWLPDLPLVCMHSSYSSALYQSEHLSRRLNYDLININFRLSGKMDEFDDDLIDSHIMDADRMWSQNSERMLEVFNK
jgi:predicted patatin/cPLA2 family phospholipase